MKQREALPQILVEALIELESKVRPRLVGGSAGNGFEQESLPALLRPPRPGFLHNVNTPSKHVDRRVGVRTNLQPESKQLHQEDRVLPDVGP